MTASINVDKFWCDGGKTFEKWLVAYEFKIINDTNADVIIIDYNTWKNTCSNYQYAPIVVILSSCSVTNLKIPINAIFRLIPIDYPILIEYLIELLELKKATV